MEQQKNKPTNAQLRKRLENAVLHIDRTKETKSIYFDDKGLRLTIDDDYAIVETNFHRHVFSSVTSTGVSRPYMYIKRFIEIAYEYLSEITVQWKDGTSGFSYQRLIEYLKDKEDKKQEYIIAYYCDMYFYSIFQNLYLLGETEISSFFVFLAYMCGIARNKLLLEEHKDGATSRQLIDEFLSLMKDFSADIGDYEVFPPMTDEEYMKQNIEAAQEQVADDYFKNSNDNE